MGRHIIVHSDGSSCASIRELHASSSFASQRDNRSDQPDSTAGAVFQRGDTGGLQRDKLPPNLTEKISRRFSDSPSAPYRVASRDRRAGSRETVFLAVLSATLEQAISARGASQDRLMTIGSAGLFGQSKSFLEKSCSANPWATCRADLQRPSP